MVTFVTMIGLAITLLLAAVLAWEAGAGLILQFLPLALVLLVFAPIAAAEALVAGARFVVMWVWAVCYALVQFVLRLGIALARPPVTALRAVRGWSDRTLGRGVERSTSRRDGEAARAPTHQGAGDAPDTPRPGALVTTLAVLVDIATSWVNDIELPVDGIGERKTIEERDGERAEGDAPAAGGPTGDAADDTRQGTAAEPAARAANAGAPSGHVHAGNGANNGVHNGARGETPEQAPEISVSFDSPHDDNRVWNPFPARRNGTHPDYEGAAR